MSAPATARIRDVSALARELLDAHQAGRAIAVPPSAREASFELASAYATEREIVRLRGMDGHGVRGVKAGFANKAMWRALKLDTLVWAHMYDDTVQYAAGSRGELALAPALAPRIEPEIVFCWKRPIDTAGIDAETVLRDHVEWLALGFEIIDCPFADWKFTPVDFVAALGLHRTLVVGDPLPMDGANTAELAEQLAGFKVRLYKDGELAEEGAGKNSLRSPALCLAELGRAMAERGEMPAPGDLVSSGTLTQGRDIAPGEVWRAELDGLGLKALELRLS